MSRARCGARRRCAPHGWPGGRCLGQVARGLRFARGLAVLPDGDLCVAEPEGWNRGSGRLVRVQTAVQRRREWRKHGQLAAAVIDPLNQEERLCEVF